MDAAVPAASVSSVDGYVNWWKFNDATGTNAIDSSTNSKTCALYNAPVWTNSAGGIGSALYFDGVTNYGSLGTLTSWPTTGSVSVTAWFRCEDVTAKRIIFAGVTGDLWWLNIDQTSLRIRLYVNGLTPAATYTPGTSITNNIWTFVASVYDEAAAYIYLNSSLSVSNAVTGTRNAGNAGMYIGGQDNLNYFKGTIDDVRIYPRALSAGEIATLYSNGPE